MRRVLTRCNQPLHHVAAGTVHPGPHPDLWGDCSGLRGDCSGLWGDCTDLSGDLDAAGLTEDDRRCGVLVTALIGEDPSHTED